MWRELLQNEDQKILWASILFVGFVSSYFLFFRSPPTQDNVPVLGDTFYFHWFFLNSYKIMLEGYEKFSKRGETWAVPTPCGQPIYILPPSVWDEIKALSPEKASFIHIVEKIFKWSLHGNILGGIHIDVIRYDLNTNLSRMSDFLIRQCDIALTNAFGHITSEWKPIKPLEALLELVHSVVSSIIVGESFGVDKVYTYHLGKYCQLTPLLTFLYFAVPSPLRSAVWLFSPVGILVRYHARQLRLKLEPEIRRRAAEAEGGEKGKGEGRSFLLLDALLERRGSLDVKQTVDDVLFMTFEQGPVCLMLVHMIYNMLSEPDYIGSLREEVELAVAVEGGWTKDTLERMPKLESFIRETVRLHSTAPLTLSRIVQQTIRLSNGTTLHPGMMISACSVGTNMDSQNYKDPHAFNGYRFYDEQSNTATVNASTTSNSFLSYGAGKQACPGRFFGVRVVKMIFAKLLLEYDMKYSGSGQKGRPPNIYRMWQILPNMGVGVDFRRRPGV